MRGPGQAVRLAVVRAQRPGRVRSRGVLGLLALLAFASACQSAASRGNDTGDGGDTDGDTDADVDGDSDSDADTDTNEPIEQDCLECVGVGNGLENAVCAIDLCDPEVLEEADIISLMDFHADWQIDNIYRAVERFGFETNDLAPRLNGSYLLLATGHPTGMLHNDWVTDPSDEAEDPFPGNNYPDATVIHDAFQLKLRLRAPDAAQAFRFDYVFFAADYEEYVAPMMGHDRFYAIINAQSTAGGEPTVINFGPCRPPADSWLDFECEPGDPGCEPGEGYCYISVLSDLSECCWYQDCPDGYASEVGTNIDGTGFECAGDSGDDGVEHGSSTGWLRTTWPIQGGEEFWLTFHIHDADDGYFDSEVIIDAFQFLKYPDYGTVKLD